MSVTKTQPVLLCKRCGKPLLLSATTFSPDDNHELLDLLIKIAGENALCDFHREQKAWYAQRNRLKEWEEGNL